MNKPVALAFLLAISNTCHSQSSVPAAQTVPNALNANAKVSFFKPHVPTTINVRTSESIMKAVPVIGGLASFGNDANRGDAFTKLLHDQGFDFSDSLETQVIAALQDAGLVVSDHSVPVAKRSNSWARPQPPIPKCDCYRWLDVAVLDGGFRATTEASNFHVSMIMTLSVIDPSSGKILRRTDFVLNPYLPFFLSLGPGAIRIPEPKQFSAKTYDQLKGNPGHAIHDLQLAIAEAATQIATATAESVGINPSAPK